MTITTEDGNRQKIKKYALPFPYLIVKDWYSSEECELIWKELDFLSDFEKLQRYSLSGAYKPSPDGGIINLSSHKSLYLNQVFVHERMSNIAIITKKLFSSGILSLYAKLDVYAKSSLNLHQANIKIGYYENNDSYGAHYDEHNFTCISYFYKEPKKFSNGNLHFVDFGIEYECLNNSMIIFPSHIRHKVNPINFFGESNKKEGRFYITQFLSYR